MDPSLAVLAALPRTRRGLVVGVPDPGVEGSWPGVADPDVVLRAQLPDWLSQYANPGARRTYAYADMVGALR